MRLTIGLNKLFGGTVVLRGVALPTGWNDVRDVVAPVPRERGGVVSRGRLLGEADPAVDAPEFRHNERLEPLLMGVTSGRSLSLRVVPLLGGRNEAGIRLTPGHQRLHVFLAMFCAVARRGRRAASAGLCPPSLVVDPVARRATRPGPRRHFLPALRALRSLREALPQLCQFLGVLLAPFLRSLHAAGRAVGRPPRLRENESTGRAVCSASPVRIQQHHHPLRLRMVGAPLARAFLAARTAVAGLLGHEEGRAAVCATDSERSFFGLFHVPQYAVRLLESQGFVPSQEGTLSCS